MIPLHRIFQFVNVIYLSISNAQFSNIQNVIIFNFFNIDRSNIYDSPELTNMIFNNITVLNNSGNYQNTDSRFASLFDIKTLLKPIEVSFLNSRFINNKIISGVIQISESFKVDLDLINCTFEGNFASITAAALSAQTMQDNLNNLQISNNIFKDNYSPGQGGVMSFINTQHNITSTNNTYINNSAQEGGVGYTFGSRLAYSELNSIYSSKNLFESIRLTSGCRKLWREFWRSLVLQR